MDWKLNENVLRGFTITIILKRDVAKEKRELNGSCQAQFKNGSCGRESILLWLKTKDEKTPSIFLKIYLLIITLDNYIYNTTKKHLNYRHRQSKAKLIVKLIQG